MKYYKIKSIFVDSKHFDKYLPTNWKNIKQNTGYISCNLFYKNFIVRKT